MGRVDLEALSDEKLVEHIRNFDEQDFGLLIKRYQQKLYVYVMRYVHDEEKAQDVLQEAFIKMYSNLNSFDADRQFSSWAYRIAHNEALNYIKKYHREVNTEEVQQWLLQLPDEKVDLAAEIDASLEKDEVRKVVYNLPMKYRDVVVLYYFEELQYEEIAKVLKIPTASVGTRIRRAKQRLVRELSSMEKKL